MEEKKKKNKIKWKTNKKKGNKMGEVRNREKVREMEEWERGKESRQPVMARWWQLADGTTNSSEGWGLWGGGRRRENFMWMSLEIGGWKEEEERKGKKRVK